MDYFEIKVVKECALDDAKVMRKCLNNERNTLDR